MKPHLRIPSLARSGILIPAALLICLIVTAPLASQGEDAQFRIGNFVYGTSETNLYIDGVVVSMGSGDPAVVSPMILLDSYKEIGLGTHTFSLVPENGELQSALISEQTLTFDAAHRYLLAVLGNLDAGDLHFTLVDETAVLEQYDLSYSAVTIMFNNLYGIPAMDSFFGDTSIGTVAYNEYIIFQDPPEARGSLFNVMGDPETVIFEYPDALPAPAGILAVFGFSGTFPGRLSEDFTTFYFGHYAGEKTILDGGTIAVGEAVPVSLDGAGQRIRYALTLATPTALDIIQAADVETGSDAYLRLYDSMGDELFENDELSIEDNSDGVWDAGWTRLQLDTGTYFLEAGAFSDLSAGEFTLSVSESQ